MANSSIPNSDAFNWVIAPAGRCVLMVGDGLDTASKLHRAIMALSMHGPMLKLLHQAFKAEGKDTGNVDTLLRDQPGLEAWAKSMLDRDLHDLHTNGVVALWAALEVAIEDTITLVLLRDASAAPLIAAQNVRMPSGVTAPPSEADARRIYRRFEQKSSDTRDTSRAYCHMFEVLGISLRLEDSVHRTLNELNYVRNCLLHRGGIVDERAQREAPDLRPDATGEIRIGQAMYMHYFNAASTFALELLNATRNSPYVRIR